jgi:hypothetical protein
MAISMYQASAPRFVNSLKLGGKEIKFSGIQYLLGFAHPNF